MKQAFDVLVRTTGFAWSIFITAVGAVMAIFSISALFTRSPNGKPWRLVLAFVALLAFGLLSVAYGLGSAGAIFA